MIKPVIRIVIAGSLILIGAVAFAQPPGPPGGKPWDRLRDREKLDEQEVREMVETIRMTRIARSLDLDREETVVLIRRIDEARRESFELHRQRREAMQALREAVEEEASEAELEERLQTVWELDNKIHEHRMESGRQVSEGLNVEQKARLYLITHDFEREMRGLIQRVRQQHPRSRHSDDDESEDEPSDPEDDYSENSPSRSPLRDARD